MSSKSVLIAMSGGVDSSVAAWMMAKRYGPDKCWGVHMLLNEEQEVCDVDTKSRTCCGTQDAKDAMAVSHHLGIDFDPVPMYEIFENSVIDNFVSEYANGRTPIPCTHCNGVLKFSLLLDYANIVGASKIATGHYVGQGLNHRLWVAADARKDQSYYLWQIRGEVLERLEFPLGSMTKETTRELARLAGIVTSEKRDSQNICFVPQGDYAKVLEQRRPDLFTPKPGKFLDVDTQTELAQEHTGFWNYTVGQRARISGLPVAYYVVSVDSLTNKVLVSKNSQNTLTSSFAVRQQNWHDGNEHRKGTFWVKTGAHTKPVECNLLGGRCFTSEPVKAAPGQAAVFYSQHSLGYMLEGGGWIA